MAVLASLWAVFFAALHLAWACGWYVGLDPVAAAKTFARPWFLAYDVIVALACCIAASAFSVLATNHVGRVRYAAHVVSVVAAFVVTLRAVAGLGAIAWRGSSLAAAFASWWDLWFVLGAVLFAAATLRTRPRISAACAGHAPRA